MATTIFLFILEPNLAILCVSIPMLRPFYAKYKKRIGGSRLTESNEASKYLDQSGRSHNISSNLDQPSTGWEMEDYHPSAKKGSAVAAGWVDESSSEKNLTATSNPRDEIRVETQWVVSHSRGSAY